MIETTIHRVKKVGVMKVKKGNDYYTNDIIIVTDNDEIFQLSLFSDTKEGLKIQAIRKESDFKYKD